MIGAIAGDIVGSVYEQEPIKSKHFPLFDRHSRYTDDSVLTISVASAVLSDGDYKTAAWELGGQYPNAGYGASFVRWLRDLDPQPYGSWGNGSAMRVSPIGWAFDSVAEVLRQARLSALISHDHPEGIKGAQAVALAVYLARKTQDKALISSEIGERFGYDLSRRLADIRPGYAFDVSCQGSVPEAITAFLESDSFEDALRNAVSLGGDSDTQACIAGGIAQAYYGGVPESVAAQVKTRLPDPLWSIAANFHERFVA